MGGLGVVVISLLRKGSDYPSFLPRQCPVMQIRIANIIGEAGCTVWLDSCQVPFAGRQEAEDFVAQLQVRLQALHPLPESRIDKASTWTGWAVWLMNYKLPYRSQRDADAFIERLQARLQAPHGWPVSSDEASASLAQADRVVDQAVRPDGS